jgi:hypothetical protein
MRPLIGVCFALLLTGSAIAAEMGDMPATAKTAEQIFSAAEGTKGFGLVESAEFHRMGRRVFALWFCPFSGRAACYLRVYYYDWEKAEWRRFINELIEGTYNLSAEMPWPIPRRVVNLPGAATVPGAPRFESLEEVIVFRSVRGEMAFKASVADLPRQPRP